MEYSESLTQFLRYHRRITFFMVIACAAVAVGLAAFMPSDLGWVGGFVVGALAQLVKFAFFDVAVVRMVGTGNSRAVRAQLMFFLLSLFLFAIAVVVVFVFKLNVWSMAAGIFLPRLILIADQYIRPNVFATSTQTAVADTGGRTDENASKEDD